LTVFLFLRALTNWIPAVQNEIAEATGWSRCYGCSRICSFVSVIQIGSIGWHVIGVLARRRDPRWFNSTGHAHPV